MKPVVEVVGTDCTGEVKVLINGKPYTYQVDAGHIPHIKRNCKNRAGYVINFLKKHNLIKKENNR